MVATDVGARNAAPLNELGIRELRELATQLGVTEKFTSKERGVELIRAARRRVSRMKRGGEGTIREAAERLLRETHKPYSELLEDLKDLFPEANTSRSSLRWYAAQMRARGEDVPDRPIDHPNQRVAA